MKPPRRKRRTIQDDPRFDDSGFQESNSKDAYLYGRSQKINPSELTPSVGGEIPIPGIMARRKYPRKFGRT